LDELFLCHQEERQDGDHGDDNRRENHVPLGNALADEVVDHHRQRDRIRTVKEDQAREKVVPDDESREDRHRTRSGRKQGKDDLPEDREPGGTIDLSGFALIGVASSIDGIQVTSLGRSGITIKNGSIRGWGFDGVDSIYATNAVIDGVSVLGNGRWGLAAGNNTRVFNCGASGNGQDGLAVASNCVLSHCTANDNGISAAGTGIKTGDRTVVTGCSANNNSATGISAGQGGRISDCTSSFNLNGITTYVGGLVTGCLCQSNTSDGINVGSSATVRSCECVSNGDDGIQIADACTVSGNTCVSNGPSVQGAGVYVLGNDCRVDDNQLSTNHYGVLVNSAKAGNFIGVKVDATNDEDPQVEAVKDKYKVVGLPTLVIYDSTGTERKRFKDFVEPEEFLAALEGVN
jgi:hypothetical protein